jgi:hypothetical protein
MQKQHDWSSRLARGWRGWATGFSIDERIGVFEGIGVAVFSPWNPCIACLSGLTTNSCIDKSIIIASKRVLLAKVDLVFFFSKRRMRFIEGDYRSIFNAMCVPRLGKRKRKNEREREPLSDKDYPWSVRPSSEVTKEKKAARMKR